ncbi:MAG: histidine--tRNA ligase [Parcubacteria group bacterium]|nr:histidine--tRNA ligase [Parcubacteria group bacterium]
MATPEPKSKKQAKAPSLLRGFKDILPEESGYFQRVRRVASDILADYGFAEIETPVLESTSLFRRTTGESSDIVEKEMFTFTDKSRESVTLRPEMTPGIARAYVEHGMLNRSQPVKLYELGPVFRYDRPQAGRFREFHQLDMEIIGNEKPVADAEIIFVSHLIATKLGAEVTVHINSLGNLESRREYVKLLKEYYRNKKRLLCEDCKRRFVKNPLRLLDCKEAGCRELAADAPQLVDNLDEDSKRHFIKVLEHLDESEVPYVLNPYIVRGLDYYNRTVFELVPTESEGAEGEIPTAASAGADAVGGGGRYDGLLEVVGGRSTPAVGMAFGVERVIACMKRSGGTAEAAVRPEIFLASLGEEAAKHAFVLFEKLRGANFRVHANFSKEGLKGQLELANKLGAVYAVILGQKELLDETVIIRDMENGIQEVVDLNKIIDEVRKRLKKL